MDSVDLAAVAEWMSEHGLGEVDWMTATVHLFERALRLIDTDR